MPAGGLFAPRANLYYNSLSPSVTSAFGFGWTNLYHLPEARGLSSVAPCRLARQEPQFDRLSRRPLSTFLFFDRLVLPCFVAHAAVGGVSGKRRQRGTSSEVRSEPTL
jgi:hypothetical protein